MRKILKGVVLALSMALFSGAAVAVILDFQSLASRGSGFVSAGNAYSEDGFTLANLSSNNANSLLSAEEGNLPYYSGSAALFNSNHLGITRLVSNASLTFSLLSIDLAEIDALRLGPTVVSFTGAFFAGGTINKVVTLDGIAGFETVHFDGFEDLISVSWTQQPQYHQFDNISLANVPEPSVSLLLGLGLLGLVATTRLARKKRA